MTDRVNGFVVVLDRDMREDDARPTLDALRMVRGVVEVRPIGADVGATIARAQARGELIARIGKVLDEFYV